MLMCVFLCAVTYDKQDVTYLIFSVNLPLGGILGQKAQWKYNNSRFPIRIEIRSTLWIQGGKLIQHNEKLQSI